MVVVRHEFGGIVRFEVLGPLAVHDADGVPIAITRRTSRLLLSVLLSRLGTVVSVGELVDAFWPDDPPAKARTNIHTYVSKLRGELGGSDLLVSEAGGYRLDVGPDELDAAVFADEVATARRARDADDPAEAERILLDALSRWRGEPYQEFADLAFVAPERQRLRKLRPEALVLRAEAGLALGRHAELVPDLAGWAGEFPDDERIAGLWMLALYRSSRRQEALDGYRALAKRLSREYAADPSADLRHLVQRMHEDDPDLLLAPAAEPEPADAATPAPRAHRFRRVARTRPVVIAAVGVLLVGAAVGTATALGSRDESRDPALALADERATTSTSSRPATSPSAASTGPASTTSSVAPAGPAAPPTTTQPPAATDPIELLIDPSDGLYRSCAVLPRLYAGPEDLRAAVDSGEHAGRRTTVTRLRITVQGRTSEAVVLRGLRIRVTDHRAATGIRGFDAPTTPSCGAPLTKNAVSASLTALRPGIWTEVSTDGDTFPRQVSSTAPELLILTIDDAADLRGEYTWEVQLGWASGGSEHWTRVGDVFTSTSVERYVYGRGGTIEPAG